MAGKRRKTDDLWELLAQRGEIDAALAEKRRELEKGQTRQRRSRQANVRTLTRSKAEPKSRSRKLTGSRRTARVA